MNFRFSSTPDRGSSSHVTTTTSRAWLRTVAGYMLAVVCLLWVFRDFNLAGLLRRVAEMNLAWVAAAIVCVSLSYVCQGVRWQFLLRPLSHVTAVQTTQAIYAGLFVNEVLPLRLGEAVRALLISRWTTLKLRSIVASILLERLCDGLWLAVGVVLVMVMVPLPRRLIEAGDIFALVILLALVVFSLLMFSVRTDWWSHFAPIVTDADRKSLMTTVITFVRGELLDLRVVAYTLSAVFACLLSLVMLLLQGLSLWFVMRACGLHVSFLAGLAVFMIVHLGTMVPAAPANIGTYQFFTVLGLTLFGIDKVTAVGFSLIVFGVLTIPILAIGFWAFANSGLTLLEVSSGRASARGQT